MTFEIGGLRSTKDANGIPMFTRIEPRVIARQKRQPLKPTAQAQKPNYTQLGVAGGVTTLGSIIAVKVSDALPSIETITDTSKQILFNNTVAQTIGEGIGSAKDWASSTYQGAQWGWWYLSWIPTSLLVAGTVAAGIGAYCLIKGCGSGGSNNTTVNVIMPQNGATCAPGQQLSPSVNKTASKVDVEFTCKVPQQEEHPASHHPMKTRSHPTPKGFVIAKKFVKDFVELQHKMVELQKLYDSGKLSKDHEKRVRELLLNYSKTRLHSTNHLDTRMQQVNDIKPEVDALFTEFQAIKRIQNILNTPAPEKPTARSTAQVVNKIKTGFMRIKPEV